MNLTDIEIKQFELKANEVRQSIIEMLTEAKSGHSAGPLGMADIFTLLYWKALKHDPKNPAMDDRDRLILSNGHICPVMYACMAHSGYFPTEELKTLRKFGTKLQGHPHREFLPALETSSGPLGSGLSQAVGMAIADKIVDKGGNRPHRYIYCMLGDGELNEGQNWEAMMVAAKYKLNNLIAIVDRNFIQIDGNTEDVMPLNNLMAKWESFNWHTQEIDGHNMEEIFDAINKAKVVSDRPCVIIARTIPGKGVGFMEDDYRWHGNPPGLGPVDKIAKADQSSVALEELKKAHEELSAKLQ